MLNKLFKNFNLGEKETKVYLSLLEGGPVTAGSLALKLNIPRSSLYGFLFNLSSKNFVQQSQKNGIKIWQATPPEKITPLINQKINSLEEVRNSFIDILPDLTAKQDTDFTEPKFTYFEGVEGVKNVLKDGLLYRDIETISFWPFSDMMDILGEDFFVYFNKRRIERNIYIKALWPKGRAVDIKKYTFLGVGDKFRREIRQAPSNIDCSMGYWAYQNKVAFISSKKESFGFVVESVELKQLLETQFDVLWQLSKPI